MGKSKRIFAAIAAVTMAISGVNAAAYAEENTSGSKALLTAEKSSSRTVTITVIDEETGELVDQDMDLELLGNPSEIAEGAGGTLFLGGWDSSKENPYTFDDLPECKNYYVQYTIMTHEGKIMHDGVEYDGYEYWIDDEKSERSFEITDGVPKEVKIYAKKEYCKYTDDSKSEDTKEETSVSEEDEKTDAPAQKPASRYIVTAVGENYVLVNNVFKLPNSQFKEYSGTDRTLKYGDVLDIDVEYILESYPGQLCIKNGSTIKYLGTVKDVYKDDIKELTVTKRAHNFELKDKDGKIYHWNVDSDYMLMCGLSSDVKPNSIIEGDVLSCAVDDTDETYRQVLLPLNIVSKVTRMTVIAASKDSVLLSNLSKLSNEDFVFYSGTDKKLKCGDVIETNVEVFLETYPMQFDFLEDSYIKYIGTADEVYKDSIKDLTVTEKKDGVIELTDENNNVYNWFTFPLTLVHGESTDKVYIYNNDIDIDAVNVGDVIKCAYMKKSYDSETVPPVSVNDVIYPISVVSKEYIPFLDEKEGVFLKGDADLNGLVELADLVAVAKYVLSDVSFPLKNSVAYKNADMNDDGNVDGLDVSALIENQLGKSKKDPEPEPVNNSETVELTANLKPISIQAAEPSKKFNNSQIDFALSLLKSTKEEKTNTLVSPYSAAQALAMTANGADKNTLKEMMKVIGGGMDIASFNNYMAGFRNDQPNNEYGKMLTANSIWYTNDAEKFTANNDFLLTNKSYYDAQIFSAPLDSNTVKDVNSWVSKHTDGMIPSILEKFDDTAVMTLINAVTFDAKWYDPFEPAREVEGYFTSADGKKQNAEVLSESDNVFYFEDKEATGFIKPYADKKYAFAAILPNEDISIDKYVDGLTTEKLSSLLSSADWCHTITEMPKFTVDYGKVLNDALKSMGIKEAFTTGADFSKMGKTNTNALYIAQVLQKTHIEVTESGTRAGAATIIEMAAGCTAEQPVYKTVKLNRPFFYAIIDRTTNVPIFIGTLETLE